MKTITMHDIYRAAWYNLADHLAHEEEINEMTKNELGRENQICRNRIKKLNAQMAELHSEILKIESAR
jgi:hypothetical protein